MSGPLYATGWHNAPRADDSYRDDYSDDLSSEASTEPSAPKDGNSGATPTERRSDAPAASPSCATERPASAVPGGTRSPDTLPTPERAATVAASCVGQTPASPRPTPATVAPPPAAVAGPLGLYTLGCALILTGAVRLSTQMGVF